MSAAEQKGWPVLGHALAHTKRGRHVIVVPFRSKNPNRKGWQNERLKEADLPGRFRGNSNLGILTGEPSNNLVDVDLDAKEAIAAADAFLPATAMRHGRPGKPCSHRWYVADIGTTKYEFTEAGADKATMLVELRSTGCQTVVPPSVHPSGEQLRWDGNGDPTDIDDPDQLQRAVAKVAACALLAKHWPGTGSRDGAAMALSGMLLRAGWAVEDVNEFVEVTARVAGDEEWRDRGKARQSDRKIQAGEAVTGTPKLVENLQDGQRVVAKVREWLNITTKSGEAASAAWDEPTSIHADLLPVKALDAAMLPDAIRPWVQDIAHRSQAPIDFAAAAAVVVAGTVVGRRLCIMPKRYDDWAEPLNLWGIGIGLPSSKKTPSQLEVMKVIHYLQAKADKEFEEKQATFQTEQLIGKIRRDVLIDEAKKEARGGNNGKLDSLAGELAALEQTEPIRTRYYTSDTTIEKLGEMMDSRPVGMLLWRDEAFGWMKTLDAQGHDGDRTLYLQSFGGKVRMPTDRIGRGSIAPILCTSILGGIQPGPLAHYVRDAKNPASEKNDGFIQRFQVSVWPDVDGFTYVDQKPQRKARDTAYEMYELLATADVVETFGAEPAEEGEPDAMPSLRFDEEAQEMFIEWYTANEQRCRDMDNDLEPDMRAHLGKFGSLMAKLAALFHMMDVATGKASAGPVNATAALRAIAWCDYLESHERRIYGSGYTADLDAARNLLKHIKRREVTDGTPVREIWRHHWEGLADREEADAAIKVLAEYGWVRVDKQRPDTGRPSDVIRLHPSLIYDQDS